MIIQPSPDKKSLHISELTINADGTMPIEEAAELYRQLFDVLQECGVKITIQAEVPPPSREKIEAAAYRVAHIRKHYHDKPWHDAKVAMEIVMRTLEVCR